MKYEPTIDRARLISTVQAAYGIQVVDLAFVPVGFAAACYVMHCQDQVRRFLKLWPNMQVGSPSAARQETVLLMTRTLYERALFRRLPYPLPTQDGALSITFNGGAFAVFPFLVGQAPPEQWSPALQSEWARTIATIHRATPALTDLLPPREDFAIPFEADLRRAIATLEHIGPTARPGLHTLRELVLPRHAEVFQQLARLHELQVRVRQLSGPFVLCHTDMGGDNLLVDERGQLSVLDWDEATLAPPEYDLHEARWIGIERVLEVYREAGGVGPLHLDHFAFCLLRRFLGDMTVRLVRILQTNTSADEDADMLLGIEAWGFAQWANLDATLGEFAAALQALRRMP